MPRQDDGKSIAGLGSRSRRSACGVGALMIGLALGQWACGGAPQQEPAPPDHRGTAAMAQRLDDVARQSTTQDNAFTPEAMVELYSQIEQPPDVRSQVQLQARLAQALLFAGRSRDAMEALDAAQQQVDAQPRLFKARFTDALLSLSAITALRLGEQENCLHSRQAASCLFPIDATGVHQRPQGAERAMALYEELLARHPDDLEARWLLNVAAMAAGLYPEGVPEPWRMAPRVFAAEGPAAQMEEMAGLQGLDVVGLSGGVVLEDFDNDGRLDLMVSSWGLTDPLRSFRNQGAEGFVEMTSATGLDGLTGGLNLVSADYDNDGLVDVLVLRGAWMGERGHHPNSLLRNLGNWRFVDVTEEVGLLDFYPTQTAAWGDYDNDGRLDLMVGNETSGGHEHGSRLFRGRPDGTFEDVTEEVGLTAIRGYVKGVAWGDYDNDGRLDLYVSRLDGDNTLWRNRGSETSPDEPIRFEDVTSLAGVAEPRHSFPTWFFDYDNDGWLDLFVSGYPVDIFAAGSGGVARDYLGLTTDDDVMPRLYRNRGDGTFADVTADAGLQRVLYTMGSNYGDIDNDGWLDMYLGTGAPDFRALMPNRLLRNGASTGGRRFLDVTAAARVGHLQKGHGVAMGDIDNDGDQDIYAVMGGAYSGDVFANALFANPGAPVSHHWLSIGLTGRASNRYGLGARIRIRTRTTDGPREIHHVVSTGGSFGSSSYRQDIGLGTLLTIEEVEVRWPSGHVDTLHEVAPDRFYNLEEGSGELRLRDLPGIHRQSASSG